MPISEPFENLHIVFLVRKSHRFLKTNAYKSVGRSALWRAMPVHTDHGTESEKLENVIEPWLLNDGMPEVIVRYVFESTIFYFIFQETSKGIIFIFSK